VIERQFASNSYLYRSFRKKLLRGEVDVVFRVRLKWDSHGLSDYFNSQIEIRKGLSLEQGAITLLHEMLHLNYPYVDDEEIIEQKAQSVYHSLKPGQRYFFELMGSS
jgi:hypothetical protein